MHLGQQGRDRRIGDVRERAGQPVGRHVATQDLHSDLELALVLPASHAVEHGLTVGGGNEAPFEIVTQLVPIRQPFVKLAADEAFEQVRAATQVLGDARRAAQDFRQPVEQARVVVEQQEWLNGGRQAAQKFVRACGTRSRGRRYWPAREGVPA